MSLFLCIRLLRSIRFHKCGEQDTVCQCLLTRGFRQKTRRRTPKTFSGDDNVNRIRELDEHAEEDRLGEGAPRVRLLAGALATRGGLGCGHAHRCHGAPAAALADDFSAPSPFPLRKARAAQNGEPPWPPSATGGSRRRWSSSREWDSVRRTPGRRSRYAGRRILPAHDAFVGQEDVPGRARVSPYQGRLGPARGCSGQARRQGVVCRHGRGSELATCAIASERAAAALFFPRAASAVGLLLL